MELFRRGFMMAYDAHGMSSMTSIFVVHPHSHRRLTASFRHPSSENEEGFGTVLEAS